MDSLMSKASYDATCALLAKVHPEDLLNILTRALMDRGDVTHASTEGLDTGKILVPGCPGDEDCTHSTHTVMPDRAFTIIICSTEL